MNIVYKHHEGSQATKPSAVDSTSSREKVYLRKTVERITREDPQTGDKVELWGYDEAELTRLEYTQYLAEADAERIEENEDAVCEMSTEMDERMTEIENALCELSEGGNE